MLLLPCTGLSEPFVPHTHTHTHHTDAKLHYKQMVDSGTSPSYFSVQCLMEAYAFHGDVPMVKELMDVERVKHGLQVSSGMVTSLMDAHVYQ